MGRRYALLTSLLLLPATLGLGEVNPQLYEEISQCILVRERPTLAGKKVQLTGQFLQGSSFCHEIRKAGINTKDYICFSLGKPCIIRMYLKKDHPQVPLLKKLEADDVITAYGTFDYLGLDYNYIILDGLQIKVETATSNAQ